MGCGREEEDDKDEDEEREMRWLRGQWYCGYPG